MNFDYEALKYSQREDPKAPQFLLFHAKASEIIEWSEVDRLAPDNPSGAQRPLRIIRAKKVAKFLKADAKNTIPTAVIIAIDSKACEYEMSPGSSVCGLRIKIPKSGKKPGLIIDGQHRVFGAKQFDANIQLNVVAFVGQDDAERAFQFVVINNSAAKVSRDHIKALNLSFDPDKLNKRLIASAGVALGVRDDKYDELSIIDSSPPFEGLIEWATNKKGFIAASALEAAISEVKDRAHLLNIVGLELDIFLQIWNKIKDVRGDVWKGFPESRLLLKTSIYALTVYILESMVARLRTADDGLDFTDEKTLDALVELLVGKIPSVFWTVEWKSKELDTTSGRRLILDALSLIDSNVRFKRAWHEGVSIIDSSAL